MWADQDNWVKDLSLDLLDADAKEAKPICSTHFSLLPYMKILPDDAKEDKCVVHFIYFQCISLYPQSMILTLWFSLS